MPKAAAKTAKSPRRSRKKTGVAPQSRGLPAADLPAGSRSPAFDALAQSIAEHGGSILGAYRDPLGGHWQLLAGLPIESVEPTPYQRDLSEPHVARLADAIDRLGRYLDPIVVVPSGEGKYWTPNGNHRLAALTRLGARSIVALVVPESEVAHRILLLNTEKAHNLRERAFEVIRLAEGLAEWLSVALLGISLGAIGAVLATSTAPSTGGNVMAVQERPTGTHYIDGLVLRASSGKLTLRKRDGTSADLAVRKPDRPLIDVQHAKSHAALGQPVRLWWKQVNGTRVVIFLEDSPLLM